MDFFGQDAFIGSTLLWGQGRKSGTAERLLGQHVNASMLPLLGFQTVYREGDFRRVSNARLTGMVCTDSSMRVCPVAKIHLRWDRRPAQIQTFFSFSVALSRISL